MPKPKPLPSFALPPNDRLIPFNEIDKVEWLPCRQNGKRPHRSFWHRAATRGVQGVKLRFLRCGRLRCTNETWLREFFADLARQPGSV